MLYLIGLSVLFLLGGVICLITGLKLQKQKTEDLISKKKDEILAATESEAKLFDKTVAARQQVEQECEELKRKRLIEQDRAQEAHDATERLLLAEQERARANLDGIKQLEEERLKNEFKAREATLEQQYQFKQKQFEEDFYRISIKENDIKDI